LGDIGIGKGRVGRKWEEGDGLGCTLGREVSGSRGRGENEE